ncbi:hypothetical protein HanRHA438_Chr05g0212951 [Helianthus annuus]|nr:hypothetical protein HanRHA438_Chr05g0212951 [Helianthus annuus]
MNISINLARRCSVILLLRSATIMIMIMIMTIFIVAGIFIEGFFFVKDAAFLGAFLLHEFVIDGTFFPRHLLLPRVEG